MEHTHKGYVIWRDKTYCYWHIRHDGKGSIPKMLDSSYLSLTAALRAIDRYREEVPESAPEVAPEAPVEAHKPRAKQA